MGEKRLRFLVVTEDSTREELAEAMVNLRGRLARCKLHDVRQELRDDIDELLDLWAAAAPATPTPA